MTSSLRGLLARLTPNASSSDLAAKQGFHKAPKGQLFPQTNAAVDGEDCLHDCESCTIRYPAKFSIEESDELYGHIKGWQRHLVVATGKTDWVRRSEDEDSEKLADVSLLYRSGTLPTKKVASWKLSTPIIPKSMMAG
jgi:hypothetical protein